MISETHLHAMLIHFPIALIMAGFLSQGISIFSRNVFFKQAAAYLLLLGALGAGAAYLSGHAAGEGIEEGPLESPMELHENAALFTLVLSIAAALFMSGLYFLKYQKPWATLTGFVLVVALAGSVAYTGYLGGQLVYAHGAGVELALPGLGDTEADD